MRLQILSDIHLEFGSWTRLVVWIHGHTHHSVDYMIGSTRIVANQRGYPDQVETGFRPEMVVDI